MLDQEDSFAILVSPTPITALRIEARTLTVRGIKNYEITIGKNQISAWANRDNLPSMLRSPPRVLSLLEASIRNSGAIAEPTDEWRRGGTIKEQGVIELDAVLDTCSEKTRRDFLRAQERHAVLRGVRRRGPRVDSLLRREPRAVHRRQQARTHNSHGQVAWREAGQAPRRQLAPRPPISRRVRSRAGATATWLQPSRAPRAPDQRNPLPLPQMLPRVSVGPATPCRATIEALLGYQSCSTKQKRGAVLPRSSSRVSLLISNVEASAWRPPSRGRFVGEQWSSPHAPLVRRQRGEGRFFQAALLAFPFFSKP